MPSLEPEIMTSQLPDVQAIASELMRPRQSQPEAMGEVEQSKIIRVERHSMSRSAEAVQPPHSMLARSAPAHGGASMPDELRKLDRKLEIILKSVEFIEAHVAMSRTQVATAGGAAEGLATGSLRRRGLNLSLAMNFLLMGLLVAELYGRSVSTIGRSHLDTILASTGWY